MSLIMLYIFICKAVCGNVLADVISSALSKVELTSNSAIIEKDVSSLNSDKSDKSERSKDEGDAEGVKDHKTKKKSKWRFARSVVRAFSLGKTSNSKNSDISKISSSEIFFFFKFFNKQFSATFWWCWGIFSRNRFIFVGGIKNFVGSSSNSTPPTPESTVEQQQGQSIPDPDTKPKAKKKLVLEEEEEQQQQQQQQREAREQAEAKRLTAEQLTKEWAENEMKHRQLVEGSERKQCLKIK